MDSLITSYRMPRSRWLQSCLSADVESQCRGIVVLHGLGKSKRRGKRNKRLGEKAEGLIYVYQLCQGFREASAHAKDASYDTIPRR